MKKQLRLIKQISIFHSIKDMLIEQNNKNFYEDENQKSSEINFPKLSTIVDNASNFNVNHIISFAVTSSNYPNASNTDGESKLKLKYDWTNKKIMIVEDDDANYLLLDYTFKKTNVNIIRAIDGIDALKKYKETSKIDLILMDIQLPLKDGYDATIDIRNINKEIPIIAQTAYSQQTDKNKCFECGCNDFITKPIDRDQLMEMLNKYLKD